jgi:hypothetical protein
MAELEHRTDQCHDGGGEKRDGGRGKYSIDAHENLLTANLDVLSVAAGVQLQKIQILKRTSRKLNRAGLLKCV